MSEKIEVIAELKGMIDGSFKSLTATLDGMDSKLASISGKGAGGGGGLMGAVLGANLLTKAISMAGSAIKDFAVGSVQAYGKQEQFQVALKTLLYGNGQQAEALNSQLKQFALETPFELTEIQEGTKMMIAYGSSAGNVVDEMRMLGDLGAGVGSSLSEIAYLYGTLRTQGTVYTRDLNQFTGRGIPIIKELAKQFHVAQSSIRGMVEEGKVGFKDVEKAFKSMTGEGGQFHNMMEAQSKTLLGQTSNLADAWDQLKTAVGSSQEGILKSTVSWATSMVSEIKRVVEEGNYLGKTQKPLGKAGIGTGIFDEGLGGNDDARDLRFLDLKTNKITNKSMRRQYNNYAGNGLYHDETASGGDAGLTSRSYAEYHNPSISSRGQLKMFSDDIFSKTSHLNEKTLQELKNELTDSFRTIQAESKLGEISPMMAASKLAVIDQAWKDIRGFEGLNKTKTDAKEEKKPKDLEKVAKQNKATQIIVNIENLVRELTNHIGDAKEAGKLTASEVAKILVGAVNDVSLIQL
jgi:tape measure domain-containing protein